MNMTVGRQVGLLAGSLLTFLLTMGGVSYITLGAIDRDLTRVTADAMPGVEHVGAAAAKAYLYRGQSWQHLATSDGASMDRIEAEMARSRKDAEEALAAYEKAVADEEDRANLAQLKISAARFFNSWSEVAPESRKGVSEAADALYRAKVDPQFQELRQLLTKMQDWNHEYGRRAAVDAERSSDEARLLTAGLLLGSMVLGLSLALFLIRRVNSALKNSVGALRQGAEQVAAAAGQVSTASQSLAHGASEQAASLEETASACEEMNVMVRGNGERRAGRGTGPAIPSRVRGNQRFPGADGGSDGRDQ